MIAFGRHFWLSFLLICTIVDVLHSRYAKRANGAVEKTNASVSEVPLRVDSRKKYIGADDEDEDEEEEEVEELFAILL